MFRVYITIHLFLLLQSKFKKLAFHFEDESLPRLTAQEYFQKKHKNPQNLHAPYLIITAEGLK